MAKDEYLYTKKQAEVDAIFEKLDSAIKALDGNLNKNLVEKQNLKQSIENAIKQAEEAKQEAEKELAKINEDGLVNPEEKAKIEQLNAKITELKTKANEVLTNALAKLTQEEAETYKERLANVTTVTVPEVTDANSNGIKDIDEIKQEENKESNGKGVTHEKPEVHFKNGKGVTHEKPYSNIIENNNSNNGIELIDKKDQKVEKTNEEKTKKIKEKVNKILPSTGIENNSSLLGLIIISIIAFSYLIRKKIK